MREGEGAEVGNSVLREYGFTLYLRAAKLSAMLASKISFEVSVSESKQDQTSLRGWFVWEVVIGFWCLVKSLDSIFVVLCSIISLPLALQISQNSE